MMPPGHEPFLRAICQAPDDDAPRLVFADWLDENGDPERAEFIRLHVQIARIPETAGAAARCEQLFRVNSRRWIACLPGPTAIWAQLVGSRLPIHSRARLALAGVDYAAKWMECEPALTDWERGFPATVYVQGGWVDGFLAAVDRVADFVPVHRLRTLWVDNPSPVIVGLTGRPFLAKIRDLILPSVVLTDEAAVALANSPFATGLRFLSIEAGRLTDRVGQAFAESPYLDGLRGLQLLHSEFNGTTRTMLRARFGFNVHL